MAVKIPPDARKFETKMLPVFLCVFILSVSGFILGAGCVYWLTGQYGDLPGLVIALALFSAISLLAAVGMKCLFKTALSAEGVYTQTAWGYQGFIPWNEIASVKPARMVNLSYLRLYPGRGGGALWLPLFLEPEAAFRDEWNRLAPKDSPVLAYL